MRKLILAVVLAMGWMWTPTHSDAQGCPNIPSGAYNLPAGIVASFEHDASGDCFVAWFDQPDEILSFMTFEGGGFNTPKLVLFANQVNVNADGNFNDHNAAYNWHGKFVNFEENPVGGDIAPSALGVGQTSYMSVTLVDWVDRRYYDMDWAGTANKVDVADIIAITTGWNTQKGEAGFKHKYDVYPDDVIDIMDVLQVVNFWNTTFTPWHVYSSGTMTNPPWTCPRSFDDPSEVIVEAVHTSVRNLGTTQITMWAEVLDEDGEWYRGPYEAMRPASEISGPWANSAPGFGTALSEYRLLVSETSLSWYDPFSRWQNCVAVIPPF